MTILTDDEVQSIQNFLAMSDTTGTYWKTADAVRKLWQVYTEHRVHRTDVGNEAARSPKPCLDPDKMNGACDQNPFLYND